MADRLLTAHCNTLLQVFASRSALLRRPSGSTLNGDTRRGTCIYVSRLVTPFLWSRDRAALLLFSVGISTSVRLFFAFFLEYV